MVYGRPSTRKLKLSYTDVGLGRKPNLRKNRVSILINCCKLNWTLWIWWLILKIIVIAEIHEFNEHHWQTFWTFDDSETINFLELIRFHRLAWFEFIFTESLFGYIFMEFTVISAWLSWHFRSFTKHSVSVKIWFWLPLEIRKRDYIACNDLQ